MADTIIFDLETDNLLPEVSKIHCIGTLCPGQMVEPLAFSNGPGEVRTSVGVKALSDASILIGHNILYYDLPVLRKLYPNYSWDDQIIIDTLLLSRLLYPDLKAKDFSRRPKLMPLHLYGRHSLEAWGYRLGCYKSEFGKTADWKEWSPEMQAYCLQDVEVTTRLWKMFSQRLELPFDGEDLVLPSWIELEHDVATVLALQEQNGWAFDEDGGRQLEQTLRTELEETSELLRARYPVVAGPEFTPARNNRTKGYIQGAPFCKLIDLKPGSREHIAWIMKTHHGWVPTEFTKEGKPVVDEVVLTELAENMEFTGQKDAALFLTGLNLAKQLGMLSEGNKAYLKAVRNGRIHHHCSVATQTHRCAHKDPNLAQVPSDLRFRALFRASPGKVMVGADLQAIELRMLSHYLARHDDGAYAKILLEDDVHQVNADKIGITRKLVKTVTYAFLYGAGDVKIGHSYNPQLPEKIAKDTGAAIRQAYMDAIPGLELLVNGVRTAAERGYIKAIDGRPIVVDAPHKALNYLLQSSAGVVAKMWMIYVHLHNLEDLGANQLAFIHDELQFEVDPLYEGHLAALLTRSAKDAGELLRLRIPIEAEAKIGQTWADVH